MPLKLVCRLQSARNPFHELTLFEHEITCLRAYCRSAPLAHVDESTGDCRRCGHGW